MSEPIKIELEINIDELKDIITDAVDLNDNQELFSNLVEFERAKKRLNAVLDQIISIEADAKGLIKSKAEALYGKEWSAIKGKGYKITRSGTGAVFSINGKPAKEFVVLNPSLDTKAVEAHIKETGKLPKGIEYNASRGSSLRITVDSNEDH